MFCFSKARCADSFRSCTAFSFGVRSSSYSCMSSCVCAERKPRPWNPAAFPFSTPNLGHDRRSTTAFGTFVVFFATRTAWQRPRGTVPPRVASDDHTIVGSARE